VPVSKTTPGRLQSFPGLGPTLASRIEAAYGGEEAFLKACEDLDLERLLSLDGLSERRAFEIVAHVRAGQTPELARTLRARELKRSVEDLLASYAQTTYGRRHLRLLPVLRDPGAIRASAEKVMVWRDQAERLDRSAVARALGRLHRLRDAPSPGPVHRLVVTDTEEDELRLRSAGLDRWVRLASGRSAARLLEDYEVVIYAFSEGGLPLEGAPNVVSLSLEDALEEAVPEKDVAFAAANRATLEAMAELARLLERPSAAPSVLEALASAAVRQDRVRLPDAAHQAVAEAKAAFKTHVEAMSLSGSEILDLIGNSTPRALEAARAAAGKAAREVFRRLTGLDSDVMVPGLPLAVDEEEVERLSSGLSATAAVESFGAARSAAQRIRQARGGLEAELASWFRFDVEFALGCFALEHDARPAATGRRLRFEGGLHLSLVSDPSAQRIDYEVGGRTPVAVLTGANSGGKSTLLEQLAQIVVLHHWGLPVPAASAEVPILEELLFLGGTRGLDAGAFETFLKDLFPPLVADGRKLVLLDEVESATELEAAGVILGVFLDEVARSGSLCVLVTHLPDQVLKHASKPVRVDGIDAVGLDERFNLIVDRQPKLGHRARSTPELIVRRVHAKSQGEVKRVYGQILDRWGTP
jgi:DNA mismatch repair protein MutS2